MVGGPIIDTGITGRKILSDTYGGIEAVVGGVLSGKDPTKLDRTATYFARYVAKNIVAAGLASRCLVQIVYAFGVVDPISLEIECYGTEQVDKRKIIKAVKEIFDFRPSCMINTLDLKRPLYTATARYGHFGRTDCQFSWEKTDNIKSLKLLVE